MRKPLTLALLATGLAGAANAQTLPSNCVETLFASNNSGSLGGAVYFDLTVTQNISIAGLLHNTVSIDPVGITVFTTSGTYVGQENNMAAWTQVAEDDGLALSAGLDQPTAFTFVAPFSLAPGTYGIALMGDNFTTGAQMQMNYTNGTGGNQNYASMDAVLSLSLGAATNVPFTGNVFSPRVWNGRLCHGMGSGPGTNYCTAVANSSGVAASLSASGTSNVALNNLVLEASDLPNNSFGFFVTSLTQGFVPMAGGSSGNLCVGGAIGRYVAPGQIQNSGGTGAISLAVDNTLHPTPTGLVMVAAGETWNYQAWFRDTSPAGPATSNFTDGLEIIHN